MAVVIFSGNEKAFFKRFVVFIFCLCFVSLSDKAQYLTTKSADSGTKNSGIIFLATKSPGSSRVFY